MSKNRRDIELIKEAIEATGSKEIADISLWLEEKFMQDIERYNQRSKAKKYTAAHAYDRMRRLGIYTTSDIERLIKEATE